MRSIFQLQPSKIMFSLLLFIHSGAATAVLTLPWPRPIKIALLFCCGGAFLYHYQQQILRNTNQAIVTLIYSGINGRNKWLLYNRQQQAMVAKVKSSSIILPWMILLHFNVNNVNLATTATTAAIPMPTTKRQTNQLLRRQQYRQRQHRNLLIFRDALNTTQFRRLRGLLTVQSPQ
jgi:hypothetical protein